MPRFYASKENVKGNLIYINGQEVRHILNVMRLGEDDKVVVFDGTGKEYVGFIKEIHRHQSFGGQAKPKSLIVEIVSQKSPKSDELPKITLAQSIPKKEKMDCIVEKATELGVHSIIPIVSERTIVRLEETKAISKVNRWKKKAQEAAKQCGRRDVPEIRGIQRFYNTLDDISNFDIALMACLSEKTISLKEAISDFKSGKIIVFIGPEGDFTPQEITMAKDTSCKFISLGRRILRSDTASLYILSVLNHEFSL